MHCNQQWVLLGLLCSPERGAIVNPSSCGCKGVLDPWGTARIRVACFYFCKATAHIIIAVLYHHCIYLQYYCIWVTPTIIIITKYYSCVVMHMRILCHETTRALTEAKTLAIGAQYLDNFHAQCAYSAQFHMYNYYMHYMP